MTNEERDTLIQQTHDMLIVHIAKCHDCRSDVLEVRGDVYGNGRPGLKTRLLTLEVTGAVQARWHNWLAITVTALLAALLTILGNTVAAAFFRGT